MTLPAIVFFIIFSYLPMFGIVIAFKSLNYSKGILGSEWVGFKNFEYLFKTNDAFIITRNTVLYNLVFIFVGTALTVALAIILNELVNKHLKKVYQTLMILPNFLSWVVVSYLAYTFLSTDYGVLNQLLHSLGFSSVSWYSTTKPWPFIIVFANLWKTLGFNSIIYFSALTGINDEFYEAALLDGATKWQQIKKITIPMIMPQIVLMTLLGIGNIFRSDFGLFYLLPKNSGLLYPVTNTIDTYVYRGLMVLNNVSMTSAAGLYQSVVGFLLVLGSNLLVRKIDPEKSLF
jgi:putative aldouronate transport system permease protein